SELLRRQCMLIHESPYGSGRRIVASRYRRYSEIISAIAEVQWPKYPEFHEVCPGIAARGAGVRRGGALRLGRRRRRRACREPLRAVASRPAIGAPAGSAV